MTQGSHHIFCGFRSQYWCKNKTIIFKKNLCYGASQEELEGNFVCIFACFPKADRFGQNRPIPPEIMGAEIQL